MNGNPWQPDEDTILRRNAHTHSVKQLMPLLPGRSYSAIENRRHRLGIHTANEWAAQSRHSDETIREARRLRREGWYLHEIAAHFDAPISTVQAWVDGRLRAMAGGWE